MAPHFFREKTISSYRRAVQCGICNLPVAMRQVEGVTCVEERQEDYWCDSSACSLKSAF